MATVVGLLLQVFGGGDGNGPQTVVVTFPTAAPVPPTSAGADATGREAVTPATTPTPTPAAPARAQARRPANPFVGVWRGDVEARSDDGTSFKDVELRIRSLDPSRERPAEITLPFDAPVGDYGTCTYELLPTGRTGGVRQLRLRRELDSTDGFCSSTDDTVTIKLSGARLRVRYVDRDDSFDDVTYAGWLRRAG